MDRNNARSATARDVDRDWRWVGYVRGRGSVNMLALPEDENTAKVRGIQMRRHGFTLIEMLVVIAIIIILVGTVVAIGTQTRTSAHIKQTKATLQNLQSLYNIWTEEGGIPFVTGTTTTTTFVYSFQTYAATKRGALSLPTLSGSGAGAVVNDGFGNPIRFELAAGGGIFRSAGADGLFSSSDDILSTDP